MPGRVQRSGTDLVRVSALTVKRSAGTLAAVLAVIQTIIGIIILTLFLPAIRRRFRR